MLKTFQGVLICSDFDGTFARKKRVSQANADALRYFQDRGGLFTLATGRSPSIVDEIEGAKISCNTHLICMNGSLIYDSFQNQILHKEILPSFVVDPVLSLLQEPNTVNDILICPIQEQHQVEIALGTSNIEEIRQKLLLPCYKILICVSNERSDEIKAWLQKVLGNSVSITRSWFNGIEINPKLGNKGTSARRLKRMIHADLLIGIGDYENDIPLLEQADIGYAMGDSPDIVKSAADHVTDTCKNDGFAKMIYSL